MDSQKFPTTLRRTLAPVPLSVLNEDANQTMIDIEPFPDDFYTGLQTLMEFDLIATHSGLEALRKVEHPWAEKEATQAWGGSGTLGASTPIRHTAECPIPTLEDPTAHIPDGDGGRDALLDNVRGRKRWHVRPARTPKSFELVFKQRGSMYTFEYVLAQIRERRWGTPAALAREFRQGNSFVRSLKWCVLREGLFSNQQEWLRCFPKSRGPYLKGSS